MQHCTEFTCRIVSRVPRLMSAALVLAMLAACTPAWAQEKGAKQPKGKEAPAKEAPAPAAAAPQQQYRQDAPDNNINTWSKVKTSEPAKAVQGMMRGTAPLDETTFKTFFESIVFPQFTLASNIFHTTSVRGAPGVKNTVCLLPQMRKDFKQMFYGREFTNQQARNMLNDMTLKRMMLIARNNYHPIARHNAMLLIADLNVDELTDPPTPYPPALLDMGRMVVDPNSVDRVRVAALAGIIRHAQAGVPRNLATPLADKILLPVIRATTPPQGRSASGHNWIRRQALEALTALYVKGLPQPQDGSFATLLFDLLHETDASLELKAAAVEALMTVKIKPPQNFDAAKMAQGIAMVASEAVERELRASELMGRPVAIEPGIKFYVTLAQRGLVELQSVAPADNIADFEEPLAALLEELDPQVHPVQHHDQLAQLGAKVESLATEKELDQVVAKRLPPGGNPQPRQGSNVVMVSPSAGATGGFTPGYSSEDRGGYPPPGRGGYGRPYGGGYPPPYGGGGRR